ncbi:carboxyl-terminal protease [Gracilibacillus boraciitolerans JCM 21714]|uniref:C-terminal processing peptidase n=1 Tax=Gracilibacillus boraciitolerans JCM 21714 TaxID=1298598 RepID=W4VQL6_9BACI|nr:S41 family peptidase [Gracilibacillus boraciitolerans]GAE95188.1 carboxyl-terminal protease [Gracilibacillus boraciitolerans JCM 21714]
MNIKRRYLVIIVVVAIALGAIGSYVGLSMFANGTSLGNEGMSKSDRDLLSQLSDQKENMEENIGKMSKVADAFSIIKENYVEDVEESQLIEGAIQGMLSSLEDPYSVYMDQETMEQFNEQIESSFEGIGAEVSMKEDNVTIVAPPIKDSPAEKAGLKPNDQVLSVDGESIDGLDLYEAVNKIRGEKGSKVVLEINRPGVEETLEIEITRDSIPLETVYVETKEQNGKLIGIIELTSFSENTANDFKKELTDLEEQGIDGLVIDVRGNPGGLLQSIEKILKEFIPEDTPYLQIEDPSGKKTRYFSDLKTGKTYPVVTLINEGSASASEILAAALNEGLDYDIVGETSFGKGTVQQTVSMGDGSTIKITRFKWLTPEGNSIHEVGVKPTIEQKMPDYYYTNPIQIEDALALDESDSKIENVQIMLEGLGYKPGRTDGYFNKSTQEAVENFQRDKEIEVTGVIDTKTAEVLQTAIIEKVRDGEDDLQLEKAIETLTD